MTKQRTNKELFIHLWSNMMQVWGLSYVKWFRNLTKTIFRTHLKDVHRKRMTGEIRFPTLQQSWGNELLSELLVNFW